MTPVELLICFPRTQIKFQLFCTVFIAPGNGKWKQTKVEKDRKLCRKRFLVSACVTMDSYDEVHDVKNGRDISTPELDVSSAIKFEHNEDDDDKEDFGGGARNVADELESVSHARRNSCEN